MPISDKDRGFMAEVADYYDSTITPQEPMGSIRDTALKFGINRNKVRKILITMERMESPITEIAVRLRKKGMSIKEIAHDLGVSVAMVSTALPYEDKIDHTLDPSEHTRDVREYRAYEKQQLERQAGRAFGKVDVPAAWKGDRMAEQKKIVNEWQKDIRMSYTEAYHRPRRFTWDDMEEMMDEESAQMTEEISEEWKEFRMILKVLDRKRDKEERELDMLLAKKSLSEEEKDRLELLRYATGKFPGALRDRNEKDLEQIAGDRLPPEPANVIRLHMEVYSDYRNDDEVEVFRKYGKLEHGDCISRDVIVPEDIPLYALHYVIQRAFGWQNSHLHQFELPDERFGILTDHTASMWSRLVGLLFRSPLMDDEDEFWADDYSGGSFKNWLRKKYTGPYMSQCHGEGIISCREDMRKLDRNREYYVVYTRTYDPVSKKYDEEEHVCNVLPVYDYEGNKRQEPKPWHGDDVPYRVEVVKFDAVPAEGLRLLFDRNPRALLERLPIRAVLAIGKMELPENCSEGERALIDSQIAYSGEDVCQAVNQHVQSIIKKKIDAPQVQVMTPPVTDVLLYNYDFGDDWEVRITASANCPDLVESGRITQAELDQANVKCREVYRPVMIARDGEMLIDDVGGLGGFANFLEKIHPELKGMDPDEKENAKYEKKELLAWAKSLGWHRDNSTNFSLL